VEQIAYYVPVSTTVAPSGLDAIEASGILWKRRYAIGLTAVFVGLGAFGGTLLLPSIYRAEVLVAPVQKDEGVGALAELGGLAALAGINLPTPENNTEEDLAILRSRGFLWSFVNKHRLMPVLFKDDWDESTQSWTDADPEDQPDLWDAYRLFKDKLLSVSTDRRTGLIRVTVDWSDPELAAVWANTLISELNEHLRAISIERSKVNLTYLSQELERSQVMELRQTLNRLIASELQEAMLANTQREFAFRVLDPAVSPDRKARPQRALIAVLSGLFAALVAAAFVLMRTVFARRSESRS
jgi:uncharacterized protein involved in exopolysaccharide biosynthesis